MPPRTPSSQPDADGWVRPGSDTAAGACFEVRQLPDGQVALRQSADPGGPALVFPADEMARFVAGVKSGAADFLL